MSSEVYILGTNHRYQGKDISEVETQAFLGVIQDTCSSFDIVAICEEFHEDFLKDYKTLINESVPKEFARKKRFIHRYCDPNLSERCAIGADDLRLLENDLKTGEITAQKFYSKRDKSFSIREEYWMKELQKLNKWPALFICGAKHSERFQELLQNNNISSIIIEKDWSYKP